ncbi:hypothetical protein L208DRAFT_1354514 [Tricholoma matsutake]|nr:hypothetical protein L208DRAFT_1354514 [Tricholoma matsutake 945]
MDSTIFGEPIVEIPGAILLSGFLQFFLLGIVEMQAIAYWADYRDDSRRKRMFIATVMFFCLLQTMLEGYKVWRTTIFQKRWTTSAIQWLDLFLNGLLSFLCEGFYVRRCWKMTNRSPWVLFPLSGLLLTIIVANIYLAIAMAVAFHSLGGAVTTLTASKSILKSTVAAFSYWIFGSLALDLAVTSISVVCLWRSKTGVVELDLTLKCIIRITVESAVLPCTCMIVAVGLYHASPHMKDHLVLFFVLLTGKLYAIGMLYTLNSRVMLRERMRSNDFGRTSLGTWQWDQDSRTTRNLGSLSEPPKSFDASATMCTSRACANSRTPPIHSDVAPSIVVREGGVTYTMCIDAQATSAVSCNSNS